MSFPQPHSSLPPKPQPSASGFKPAFAAASSSNGAPGTRSYDPNNRTSSPATGGGFSGFKPRTIAPPNSAWRNSTPTVSASPAPPMSYPPQYAGATPYQQQQYPVQPQQSYHQQPYYPQSADVSTQPTPPQIHNPFPLPGQDTGRRDQFGNTTYDPEYEAQLAQWQSAYAARDDASTSRTQQGSGFSTTPAPSTGPKTTPAVSLSNHDASLALKSSTDVASVVLGANGKDQTVVRSGGGTQWQDSSLLEWDPAHFRLFVGNLAGEVTDESLLKAFSKYDSVQRARVVREKRTTKSKGYGFVSFSDGDQFFKAAKEMQGKYIGSHPVILRRSTTEIKATVPRDQGKGKRGGKGGKGGGGGGGHADTGAGVQKKQNKTKGGLKILG